MDTIAFNRGIAVDASPVRIPGLRPVSAVSTSLPLDLRSYAVIPPRHLVSGEYCVRTQVKGAMGWDAKALGGVVVTTIDTFQTRVGPQPPSRPPV